MSKMSELHAVLVESGELARVEGLQDAVAVFERRIVEDAHVGERWVALLQRCRASVVAELESMLAGAL